MDWKKLQEMRCPSCGAKIEDHALGYKCQNCDFNISFDKFRSLINKMMMPSKPKYHPDRVDRSNWEW